MFTRVSRWLAALATAIACATPSCSVGPPQPVTGVNLPLGPCGHALFVLTEDDGASSVGIVGWDGKVISPAVLSAASSTTGLSAPLPSDVVSPTMLSPSGVVLITQAPTGTVTFFDPPSGKVRAQLPVGNANPYDYVEVDSHKAYVSRYDIDKSTMTGADVIVTDPSASKPTIESAISVAAAFHDLPPSTFPHPGRMLNTNNGVLLVAPIMSAGYRSAVDGGLVRIDPANDTISLTPTLTGLHSCWALALSPSGNRVAVGCPGDWPTPDLTTSGLAVLDTASLSIVRTWKAADLGGAPVSEAIAFASDDALLVPTMGSKDNGTVDHLLRVQISTGVVSTVATSANAFDFGEVRCGMACGACFLTDADLAKPRLRRFQIDADGNVTGETDVPFGDATLRPRYLGAY